MFWHFQLRTADEPRMPSRILQVLGTQRLPLADFKYQAFSSVACVAFCVVCDPDHARRIGALLLRLQHVQSAVWVPIEAPPQGSGTSIAIALRSEEEDARNTQPDSPFWSIAPSVFLQADSFGRTVLDHTTDVRLRWTSHWLYVLFIAPYQELHLRTDHPQLEQSTEELWNHDVAEVFIGQENGCMQRYCEFELSPRGEWLDLNIDVLPEGRIKGTPLLSHHSSSARLEHANKTWYGLLRIPMAVLLPSTPAVGSKMKINFYRSQGSLPVELAWQPTFSESFHRPLHFGTLLLAE